MRSADIEGRQVDCFDIGPGWLGLNDILAIDASQPSEEPVHVRITEASSECEKINPFDLRNNKSNARKGDYCDQSNDP